jgi:hypothetical protein
MPVPALADAVGVPGPGTGTGGAAVVLLGTASDAVAGTVEGDDGTAVMAGNGAAWLTSAVAEPTGGGARADAWRPLVTGRAGVLPAGSGAPRMAVFGGAWPTAGVTGARGGVTGAATAVAGASTGDVGSSAAGPAG